MGSAGRKAFSNWEKTQPAKTTTPGKASGKAPKKTSEGAGSSASDAALPRRSRRPPPEKAGEFNIGDRVFARGKSDGEQKKFDGIVIDKKEVQGQVRYEVEFDDGDKRGSMYSSMLHHL